MSNQLRFIHDFTAPFFQYAKVDYQFNFLEIDSLHSPTKIAFESQCSLKILGKEHRKLHYHFEIEADRIAFYQKKSSHHSDKKHFVICELD